MVQCLYRSVAFRRVPIVGHKYQQDPLTTKAFAEQLKLTVNDESASLVNIPDLYDDIQQSHGVLVVDHFHSAKIQVPGDGHKEWYLVFKHDFTRKK